MIGRKETMKKITALSLALILCCSFATCASSVSSEDSLDVTYITLTGDSITLEGGGASVDGKYILLITSQAGRPGLLHSIIEDILPDIHIGTSGYYSQIYFPIFTSISSSEG